MFTAFLGFALWSGEVVATNHAQLQFQAATHLPLSRMSSRSY